MKRGWASLTFALCLLGCPEEDSGNPPAVSAGSNASLGPGSGPATSGTSGDGQSSGPGTSATGTGTGTGTATGTGTGTATGMGSSATGGPTFTGGPVETGSDTTCGDWAERYIQCVDPTGSVVSAENTCTEELLNAEKFGLACGIAVEESYLCLTGVTCQALYDWAIDDVIPEACSDEFDAVGLNCPD